jgi:hypothetical protein
MMILDSDSNILDEFIPVEWNFSSNWTRYDDLKTMAVSSCKIHTASRREELPWKTEKKH